MHGLSTDAHRSRVASVAKEDALCRYLLVQGESSRAEHGLLEPDRPSASWPSSVLISAIPPPACVIPSTVPAVLGCSAENKYPPDLRVEQSRRILVCRLRTIPIQSVSWFFALIIDSTKGQQMQLTYSCLLQKSMRLLFAQAVPSGAIRGTV